MPNESPAVRSVSEGAGHHTDPVEDDVVHTSSAALEMHVLGSSVGESIVLRLPDGAWGVVDCYTSRLNSPANNPTLQFLRANHVTKLAFLCLTHPHEDHFQGMSDLLAELDVERFWLFDDYRRVMDVVDALQKSAELQPERFSADDLRRTLNFIEPGEQGRRVPLRFRVLATGANLYPDPVGASPSVISIEALAPDDEQKRQYYRTLSAWIRAGQFREPPRMKHNIISGALLIRYGGTRLVLGGDVEQEGWHQVLQMYRPEQLAASAVKVSHHGSPNGHCTGLWEAFGSNEQPYAVVSRYAPSGRPRPRDIAFLHQNASHVMVTHGGEPTYDLPSDLPPSGRAALVRETRAFRYKRDTGICSLSFNDQGECTHTACTPPHTWHRDWWPQNKKKPPRGRKG